MNETLNLVATGSDISDSDSDEFLTPELLERERQLIERNKQLEDRLKGLLRSDDLGMSDIPLKQDKNKKNDVSLTSTIESTLGSSIKKKTKYQNYDPSRKTPFLLPDDAELPEVRVDPTNDNILEVDIPTNVQPVPIQRFDPVPELREAFHKIAKEIKAVNEQIADIQKSKSQCELSIAKLQTEFKKCQVDSEHSSQRSIEYSEQIKQEKEKITKLKNDVSSARLHKIEKVQRQNEIDAKRQSLESKIRRQRSLYDRLTTEFNSMPKVDSRAAKMNTEKAKLQQSIDTEKKAIRQLKLLLADIGRAAIHEDKIFEHVQNAKNIPLTSENVQIALTELL